jgi:glycosyltransferase involved in cell wall biosynthesis
VLYIEENEAFDENKFIINSPPLDPFLLDENNNPSNKIFYNHRLYKHYGSDFLFILANELSSKFDINLNILDALGERSEEQNRMDPSVEEVRSKLSCIKNVNILSNTYDRYIYREAIRGSLFSIAPYRENCVWAMSCVDSMAMGVPVIAPNIAWFKEFMPSDLCFFSIDEALGIAGKLISDKEFWIIKSNEAKKKVAQLSPALIAEMFLGVFSKGV